ncbi:hypothetical protein EXQ42_14685, partial [Clostridium botulinum]|nr:hypothetical protein [Clostridium botulinum]
QLSKINNELNKEKSKKTPKTNVELKNQKSKQILKEQNALKKEKEKQLPKVKAKLKEEKEIANRNTQLKNEKDQQLSKISNELNKEKSKQTPNERIESKNKNSKQVVNRSAQLKNEKSQQISKINTELKKEKNKQVSNGSIKSKKEKSKQVANKSTQLKNEKSQQVSKINTELNKDNNNIRKNTFSKVPIVIASFETEITEIVFTKIEDTFIDIKEVKNNIFIEEANLIKLNFNKAELFISGYIRSYIEYITLDQINESSITTKNQGIISHKDFSKAININLLFFNNMKEGEAFFVDFNNYIKDKKILLGKIEKLDIKSSNIYKDVENSPFEREKCYLTLQQNLLIRAKINVLQNNVVIL